MLSSNKTKTFTVAFLVSFIAVLIFLPALQNGFVNWDDNLNIYKNPAITSLDASLLKYMFSFSDTTWSPLTRFFHALNYAVWELDPMGHHLTNIVFHGFNTFLVVIIAFGLLARWLFQRTTSDIQKNILNAVRLGKLQFWGRVLSRMLLDSLGVGIYMLATFILFVLFYREGTANYLIVSVYLITSYYIIVLAFGAKGDHHLWGLHGAGE